MPAIDGKYHYGNPFKMTIEEERLDVTRKYAQWVATQPELVARVKSELRDKILACWCAPKMCHCNIIVQIANR